MVNQGQSLYRHCIYKQNSKVAWGILVVSDLLCSLLIEKTKVSHKRVSGVVGVVGA